MAQSVRRPETLGAMDHEPQRDKTRTSYFGNVKTRLGSKLPPGVSQPPQFAKRPWETQPQARVMQNPVASSQRQHQPAVGRPLNHIPHIRNPKLRQYYLQGTSWDLNNAAVKQEHMGGPSDDSTSSRGLPGDTVFSVSSQFNSIGTSSAEEGKMGHRPSQFSANLPSSSAATLIPRDLIVPKGKNTGQGSSQPELDWDSDPKLKREVEADSDSVDIPAAQPQSPSPEAEYDKLLDVEAVPMPDGQLCLLALPPECCQGEGPEAMQYLKLFCRYITDRKGVVSGILLVTSNKIFFDPCKTHPLVKEHGCEEYLLSCSVDSLASVSFFSDISHVHFNTSQQRKKGKKIFQKLKSAQRRAGGFPNRKGESAPAVELVAPSELSSQALSLTKEVSGEEEEAESRDMAEAEGELDSSPLEVLSEASVGVLGVAVLSSAATFCCGGQEAASKLLHSEETQKTSVRSESAERRSSTGSPGSLMFVRLRVQPSAGKKKGVGGLQLGSVKTLPRRDSWLALSQESSDELYAYLTHCRPDLCILEGGEEEREVDRDEEEFVLIEDKGEEEEEEEDEDDEGEEVFQRHRSSGDDWEMVLMEESVDKPTLVIDREPDGLNNIVESSHILEASHVRELCKELPPRTVGHTWQLAYSTSRHGASLKSLYRKLSATDSPVLLVIKDALDEIFGAFLSHPLKLSETFYGTGETFLFMLHPRFKSFRWTGENSFFIKGDLDSFAIGGVVTLVCGWMRICTWVAAAPATPSITVASLKPTTSGSWSWRCGHSAEETERPRCFSLIASSLLISFIETAFITERKNKYSRSFISCQYQPQTSRFVCVIKCCGF
ncbi:oxidation resistance protein 1 isoform X2 [Dicentrarchus labrax]|uniref:oxidation resistance protein 1 isoform X2 n=1 Tax=Dicentrarchus labrax TaxID=13489 RepID=UPI0021F646BB|nr:oxidation resistance protein 1 isoform X2 [Dicentrarchus labrax]